MENRKRCFLIDKNGIVAGYDINTYVLHWKDEYYFAITSGSLDFLRFDEIDSWYFQYYHAGPDIVWAWNRAWVYTWERAVFLGEIEVDYQYVDSIPAILNEQLGLLQLPDLSDVPDELSTEFEEFLNNLIYGSH